MFDSFEAYPWFLKVLRYETPLQLLTDLDHVIHLVAHVIAFDGVL